MSIHPYHVPTSIIAQIGILVKLEFTYGIISAGWQVILRYDKNNC